MSEQPASHVFDSLMALGVEVDDALRKGMSQECAHVVKALVEGAREDLTQMRHDVNDLRRLSEELHAYYPLRAATPSHPADQQEVLAAWGWWRAGKRIAASAELFRDVAAGIVLEIHRPPAPSSRAPSSRASSNANFDIVNWRARLRESYKSLLQAIGSPDSCPPKALFDAFENFMELAVSSASGLVQAL